MLARGVETMGQFHEQMVKCTMIYKKYSSFGVAIDTDWLVVIRTPVE